MPALPAGYLLPIVRTGFIVRAMRTILLAVAMIGCGTSSDAHDAVACGNGWVPGFVSCERACQEPPANFDATDGPMCIVPHDSAQCVYFEYEGIKGCCVRVQPPQGDSIAFAECE